MPYADWAGVRRDLTTALDGLADREFLILGDEASGRGTSLFGLRPKPASSRYVQVLRIGDIFTVECVGATSLGGSWAMDEPTIERLCSMGWLTPAQSLAEFGNVTPNFELYAELPHAQHLADLLVASLAVLGAVPAALALQSPGGTAQLVG
jgi:hypothetical protein